MSISQPVRNGYVKLYNGYDFPLLGLGTYSPNKDEPWTDAVKDAIDIGYRHFDCASFYGNEKKVGMAINEKIAEGVIKREDIFVTSKLWNNKHEREAVVPALKKSLANLNLEYLDLYLIHWPFSVPDIEGEGIPKNEDGEVLTTEIDYNVTWKGMEECVEKGLTRSIGLSNFNFSQMSDVMRYPKIKPAVLQVESHPYLAQTDLVNYCKSVNVVMTAYRPLGSKVPTIRGLSFLDHPVMKALATKYNKSTVQIALKFHIDRGVGVIPKSTNITRMKENFDVFDFTIGEKNLVTIAALNKDERYVKFEEYADHRYYPFKPDNTRSSRLSRREVLGTDSQP